MFVSYKKYKRLKDDYDFLSRDRKRQISQLEDLLKTMSDNYCEAIKEAYKYKSLYADEFQKRLKLAESVQIYEKRAANNRPQIKEELI